MVNDKMVAEYYLKHKDSVHEAKRALIVHSITMQYIERYGEMPEGDIVEEILDKSFDYLEEVSFGSIDSRVYVAMTEVCEEEEEEV